MDHAVVFGKYQNLVGTVTEPIGEPSSVAAIFLTAGMLHHAGPYRLHVDLAHEVSKSNILSIRFDLSGIGESLGVGQGGRSIDRAANETAQAMDYLSEKYGIKKFVLFGLCSGADDSVHTALTDKRVVGVVALDGCGYRTKRFYWHRLVSHYAPRLMMLSKWTALIKRSIGTSDGTPNSLQMGTDVREFPDCDVAESVFQSLADRDVRMHFVYTGGVAEYYNYADQFFDMFQNVRWNENASTTFFPHMDHVAMLCDDREQLVRDVTTNIVYMAKNADIKSSDPDVQSPVVIAPAIDSAVGAAGISSMTPTS